MSLIAWPPAFRWPGGCGSLGAPEAGSPWPVTAPYWHRRRVAAALATWRFTHAAGRRGTTGPGMAPVDDSFSVVAESAVPAI